MKLLVQIGLVFGLYWISQCVESVLPFAFPASVIGLIVLLVLLLSRVIKEDKIRNVSEFLLGNLQFFFIPVTVSIMNYVDLILENGAAFLVICVVSLLLTFGATAWAVTLTMRLLERRKK